MDPVQPRPEWPTAGARFETDLESILASAAPIAETPLRRPGRSRAAGPGRAEGFDLVCLSHLRWDFVYQRPQHLLGRCAKERRVFFVEEPVLGDGPTRLEVTAHQHGVRVAVPHLPAGLDRAAAEAAQRSLLDELFEERAIRHYVLWYYTPMALGFTDHLEPLATVYDCMDELSAFAAAPPEMLARESELLARANLVFAGGQSLYEAKRGRHPRVHAFPSSVDTAHFAKARDWAVDPHDQAGIPGPRLGFCGVIDERLDRELLAGLADARPDWQIVMVGPVVKIDPADLPRRPNIHYLGGKRYEELPAYLGGWDVALLPLARNESTRFISPTKTPEYLAAGRPVVSTSIRDVVHAYGEAGLVRIADRVEEFAAAVEAALSEDRHARRAEADRFLRSMSWDRTWARMSELLVATVAAGLQDEVDAEAAASGPLGRRAPAPTDTRPTDDRAAHRQAR